MLYVIKFVYFLICSSKTEVVCIIMDKIVLIYLFINYKTSVSLYI